MARVLVVVRLIELARLVAKHLKEKEPSAVRLDAHPREAQPIAEAIRCDDMCRLFSLQPPPLLPAAEDPTTVAALAVRSALCPEGLILSYPILSYPILSYPILLSNTILYHPILRYTIPCAQPRTPRARSD